MGGRRGDVDGGVASSSQAWIEMRDSASRLNYGDPLPTSDQVMCPHVSFCSRMPSSDLQTGAARTGRAAIGPAALDPLRTSCSGANLASMNVTSDDHFFRVWLPQIIGYAEMIEKETDLRKAWIDGVESRTSIYYPGELICQLEDLTPPEVRAGIKTRLAKEPALAEAVEEFLARIERLWSWTEANMDTEAWARGRLLGNAEEIFTSGPWLELRDQARTTAALAHRGGFRSGDAVGWI